MAALGTLRNSCSEADYQQVVRACALFVNNLLQNPGNPKFQRVRVGNRAFQNRVACHRGGLDLMRALGFREVSIAVDGAASAEQFLEMSDASNPSRQVLHIWYLPFLLVGAHLLIALHFVIQSALRIAKQVLATAARPPPATPAPAAASAPPSNPFASLGGMGTGTGGMGGLGGLGGLGGGNFAEMQRQMMQNPAMLQQMMSNPMVRQM